MRTFCSAFSWFDFYSPKGQLVTSLLVECPIVTVDFIPFSNIQFMKSSSQSTHLLPFSLMNRSAPSVCPFIIEQLGLWWLCNCVRTTFGRWQLSYKRKTKKAPYPNLPHAKAKLLSNFVIDFMLATVLDWIHFIIAQQLVHIFWWKLCN